MTRLSDHERASNTLRLHPDDIDALATKIAEKIQTVRLDQPQYDVITALLEPGHKLSSAYLAREEAAPSAAKTDTTG